MVGQTCVRMDVYSIYNMRPYRVTFVIDRWFLLSIICWLLILGLDIKPILTIVTTFDVFVYKLKHQLLYLCILIFEENIKLIFLVVFL